MAMLTGFICHFADGRDKEDGKAYAFIRPDDGTPDVFAPVRTLSGVVGDHNHPKLLDFLRQAAAHQKQVLYHLKDDERRDNAMAATWKMIDGDPPAPSRSPTRSPRRSPSRSNSWQRSRSKGRSRSRSPSRRSYSPSQGCKVTVCDIPSDMTPEELQIIGGNIGERVLSSRTYKRSDRFFGVLGYSDRQAAEKCISKLDGRRMHGSEFRLRCVLGLVHDDYNNERHHDRCQHEKRGRSGSPSHQKKHDRSRSPNRNWNTQHNKTFTAGDVRPGDWTCPKCDANVFASKDACFKCGAQKPPLARDRGRADGIMTLFVIDLPVDIQEDELRNEFERVCCGRKSILRVMLKPKSKVFANAFVRFSAAKLATRAMQDIEDGDITVRGRTIRCFWSHTNTELK